MTIRAVIFDWGGTLTPWHTIDPREAWLAATGDAGIAAQLSAAEDAASALISCLLNAGTDLTETLRLLDDHAPQRAISA